MNNEFKDYYKILGVTPRASFENIRSAAERELSQNWNNAIGRLEIQEAYEILSNPEKRKEYDIEFNRRLNEREVAIRNARTFEEYIAATSLHSELANVDVAPEVTVPQEEITESEINNEFVEQNLNASESTEEKEQQDIIDLSIDSGYSEPSSEDTESSQDAEEEVQEDMVEQEQQEQELEEEKLEEEKEEEKTEEEREEQQVEQNQISDQEFAKEQTQERQEQENEFINIPIKRLENEIKQNKENESIKESKQEIQEEPIISRAALKEIIRAAIIAGGVGVGALVIGGVPGVVIGLMAGVATGDFFKKHAKLERKPDFQKESKPLEVKEVNTEETKYLNDYAENLENQIYDLLDKPSKNYELEIAIRKYENLVELTEKRLKFKRDEAQKDCTILKRLELNALEKKLDKLEKTKKQLKEKKSVYESEKTSSLSKLNQQISNKSHEIAKLEPEESKAADKEKVIRAALLKKRDAKANRLYVNKDIISFGQVALVKLNSAKNIVKSTVNKFIDLDSQEQVEETNSTTLSK